MNKQKMNPEVKAAWLKALRSGEYQQAKGALRIGNYYNVLGVLCNLHALEHYTLDTGRDWVKQGEYWSYFGYLNGTPSEVETWAALDSSWGTLEYPRDTPMHIEDLNDRCMLDFNEIADIIEAQL